MIPKKFEDLKSVPERLAKRPAVLAKRARYRASLLRGESAERLFTVQSDALEKVETLLGKAPERVPLVSRVADAAEKAVHERREALTAPPVEGYADMNAKDAIAAVRELDRVDLLKVKRYEEATKDRVTVLRAVSKRFDELDAKPDDLVEAEKELEELAEPTGAEPAPA